MKVVEENITRNCLRKDSETELILGNTLLVTELELAICICVHCKTINTLKKHLSPALESGAV